MIATNFLAFADDIAIQPDNKIILSAPCRTLDIAMIPFCLARMNEDGSMDSSFKGGVPNTSLGGVFTSFSPAGSGVVRGIALPAPEVGRMLSSSVTTQTGLLMLHSVPAA
jgi:hypothetical protein